MSSTNTQQYFICPITLKIFKDPVIAQDGITYEREAIIQWINQHGTSPLTKTPIYIQQLTSNNTIKDAIKTLNQQNTHNGQVNLDCENLDVLCLYCGSTQKLNTIQEHKSQCSSNPVNIQPFNIAENETIFTLSQETSSKKKPSRTGKSFSFQNPFAQQTINNNSPQISITHNTENITNHRCSRLTNRQIKYLSIILSFIILTIIAITLAVYYTTSKKESLTAEAMTSPIFTSTSSSILYSTLSSISTSTLSSTTSLKSSLTTSSTSTSTSSSPSTSTSSSTSASSSAISLTSTSTSSPTVSSTSTSILSSTLSFLIPTLCASAEWDPNAITVASGLYDPYDIAIDSEDNLIVADTEKHLLRKFFPNGTNITLVTNTKITSVFIDKFDNIYFTDAFGDEVHLLNSDDGEIITVAGGNGPGSELDQLKLDGDPRIYVDQNLSLYISDTGNHRVVKYFRNATSGIIVAGGHGPGSALNQLNTPYGIYVDEFNEIGAIYICDTFNRRIQKWLEGTIQGITVAFHAEQLRAPISILLASTLDHIMMMYISSFDLEQVLKWIPYAEEAQSVVAGSNFGSDSNQLEAPRGIKFDKNWNLFVADTGNNRIQKLLFNTSSCFISY